MENWRPGASSAALQARAELFSAIREFFATREVLEVDTPLLARYGVTDPHIEPLMVSGSALSSTPLYLQTSPEFAMKRLLAAGIGSIYQLGRAFRDGEAGGRHNPEFTLLEWYRVDFDLHALMDEVGDLVSRILGRSDFHALSYRQLCLDELALDPWNCDTAELATQARQRLEIGDLDLDREGWLDLLFSHCVEPSLRRRGRVFVYDYPPAQAALATTARRGGRCVAERFELYVDGVELANGYRELRDADELLRRARRDNQLRRDNEQQPRELDPRLIAAMRSGLPDCCGVALGVDRLLMLRLGASTLSAALPFDWSLC